jgi:hypothetical protein
MVTTQSSEKRNFFTGKNNLILTRPILFAMLKSKRTRGHSACSPHHFFPILRDV